MYFNNKLMLIIIMLVIAGVCSIGWQLMASGITKAIDPSHTGGVILEGTSDIEPSGDQNFSISPNGRWILYPAESKDPFEPAYVLYDVRREQPHVVTLSPRVQQLSAEGRGPLRRAGCWNSEGTQVFLPGDNILFVANITDTHLQWDVIENVERKEFIKYYDCFSSTSEVISPVRVIQLSDHEVLLVDAQNTEKILARHQAGGIAINRIDIQNLTVSPDTKKISYVVTMYRGSFVTPSRGYILDLAKGDTAVPQMLAAPVFGPLRWSSDSTVVYASVRSTQKGIGIYQWKIN